MRTHQSLVRAQLRHLTGGQWALADDLAQETFLRAWRGMPRFRGESRFGTWLYRIAYNTYLMHRRANRISTEDEAPGSPDDAAALPPSIDGAQRGELQRALQSLSPSERAAIVHCYYLELSHAEAASVLGWPLGTVKSHIRRGLDKLRHQLGERPEGSETHESVQSSARA